MNIISKSKIEEKVKNLIQEKTMKEPINLEKFKGRIENIKFVNIFPNFYTDEENPLIEILTYDARYEVKVHRSFTDDSYIAHISIKNIHEIKCVLNTDTKEYEIDADSFNSVLTVLKIT